MKLILQIIILTIFTFFISITSAYSHKEWVHQHIVKEAYKFLENEIGEVTEIKNNLGADFFGNGGKNHWDSDNSIVIGAWREDVEDILYMYGDTDLILLGWSTGVSIYDGFVPSITHFWDADNGDAAQFSFFGANYENARVKAFEYTLGDIINQEGVTFFDYKKRTFSRGFFQSFHARGMYRRYRNLFDYLVTKEHYKIAYSGVLRAINGTILPESQKIEEWETLQEKSMQYNIVGRILHLLADMSVPAHVHDDVHVCDFDDGDAYELWIASNDVGDCNAEHTSFRANGKDGAGTYGTGWNALTAREQGGFLYEVFSLPDQQALHYLFYTVNQLADHYPSFDQSWKRDASGDNNQVYYNDPLLEGWYDIVGPSITNDPEVVENSDVVLNYCIRASATFLYWLAVKTGLVECPDILYLQNNIYYGNRSPFGTDYKAKNKVIAGSSVRQDLPIGEVINKDGSISEYYASEEVILKDGFIAEEGSDFWAYITDNTCDMEYYENNSKIKKNNNIELKKYTENHILTSTTDSVHSVSIYVPKYASFSGDNVDYLYISDWLFEEHNHKNQTTHPDSLSEIGDIYYYADSVNIHTVFLNDTVYVDTLSIEMIGDYYAEITVDSGVFITKNNPDSYFDNNNQHNFEMKVIPNPSTNNLLFEYELTEASNVTIQLFSESGDCIDNIVSNQQKEIGKYNFDYSISNLSSGVYFCKIKTDKSIKVKKIIIIK